MHSSERWIKGSHITFRQVASEAADIRTEARRAHGELVGRGQRKTKEWAAWRPGRDWTIPRLSPGWEIV